MIFRFVAVITILAMMAAGAYLHESDDQYKIQRDIYNYTNQIGWNESEVKINLSIDNNQQTERIDRLVTKTINYFANVFIEVYLWSFEWGYNHYKEYNFMAMMKFLFWILIIWIVIIAFPIIPPLLALLYLCYLGIKKLILKIKS